MQGSVIALRSLDELLEEGPPQLFETDPETIKASLIETLESLTGRKLYDAQVEMFLIETLAYHASVRNTEKQAAVEQNLSPFATGPHLDNLGALTQTFRLTAQSAGTRLSFTLKSSRPGDLIIPKGTRVSSGDFVFATIEATSFPAGSLSAEVEALAEVAGATANDIAEGAITTLFDALGADVEVSNITPSQGGSDREDDGHFRRRVISAPEKFSQAGPRRAYEHWVLQAHPDINDVYVRRPAPGEIEIYAQTQDGPVNPEIATRILATLDELTVRPMGDDVTVISASPIAFDCEITLYLRALKSGLEAQIQADIENLFALWRSQLGGVLTDSEIKAAAERYPEVVGVSVKGIVERELSRREYRDAGSFTIKLEVVAND